MRYENKKWHRTGNHFQNTKASMNLENIRVLHIGVDTVKELFKCVLNKDVLTQIQTAYDSDFDRLITLGGLDWLITRSAKTSGYQWILRNAHEGLTVLLKSFYAEPDIHASHVKIEASPQLIGSYRYADFSAYLIKIARIFADQVTACGCAVHLAVDVKGWEVPPDFEYSLVTRAKRKMQFSGVSQMTVDMAEVAAIYGDRQTYTFGSASSVQLCVYDKVTEAIKSDKIGYWEHQWRKIPSVQDVLKPEYQEGDKVVRIEGRLHHSVIQQFCNGTVVKPEVKNAKGEVVKPAEYLQINNFSELSKYLNQLWRYILNNFRLHYSSSYVHPLWQLLEEDIDFSDNDCGYDVFYDFKRAQKPPSDNVKRKMGIWLGNTIRLYSRKRFKTSVIVDSILKTGLDQELIHYFGLWDYEDKQHLHAVLTDFVSNKKRILTLQGIAA